jgi:hypothetical protein
MSNIKEFVSCAGDINGEDFSKLCCEVRTNVEG